MEKSFCRALLDLPQACWSSPATTAAAPGERRPGLPQVRIWPIRDEEDLWYVTAQCQLAPEQQDLVDPVGFSIGRAWLAPTDRLPCAIGDAAGRRVGFILFLRWLGGGEAAASWSYLIDQTAQGQGYGRAAACLAVSILQTALPQWPIKLATERDNLPAQRLYRWVGFAQTDELDGDDLVFML